MADAVVKVEGARELRATMRKAGHDLGDLKDAHAEVAGYVAGQSSTAAPRVSGSLAGSIRGNRAATSAVVKAGRASVPYAGPIHYGWPRRNITAQPFLTDTAANTEPTWTHTYLEAIRRIVDNIHGK